MPNIPEDETVLLQVQVPDSLRRFIKAKAALENKSLGEWLRDVLTDHLGYEPPKESNA